MTDERLPERDKEYYMGDGVYVSLDGYQIWLRAERDGRQHRVALEPEVWQALRTWIDRYPLLKSHMEDKP